MRTTPQFPTTAFPVLRFTDRGSFCLFTTGVKAGTWAVIPTTPTMHASGFWESERESVDGEEVYATVGYRLDPMTPLAPKRVAGGKLVPRGFWMTEYHRVRYPSRA